jgi:hypothetical protein
MFVDCWFRNIQSARKLFTRGYYAPILEEL